jgi:hypothetical protein
MSTYMEIHLVEDATLETHWSRTEHFNYHIIIQDIFTKRSHPNYNTL